MSPAVVCHLVRARDEVREVFTVHLPADPKAARMLLEHHLASAIRGDSGDPGQSRRYRLKVHATDLTHLYDVEAS